MCLQHLVSLFSFSSSFFLFRSCLLSKYYCRESLHMFYYGGILSTSYILEGEYLLYKKKVVTQQDPNPWTTKFLLGIKSNLENETVFTISLFHSQYLSLHYFTLKNPSHFHSQNPTIFGVPQGFFTKNQVSS